MIKIYYKPPKTYKIKHRTEEEFKRKFVKILRKNGIEFSEYMDVVNVFDAERTRQRAHGDSGERVYRLDSRYMMIVKILSNISIEETCVRDDKFVFGRTGYVLSTSFLTINDVEYWDPSGAGTPFFSKFKEEEERIRRGEISKLIDEEVDWI